MPIFNERECISQFFSELGPLSSNLAKAEIEIELVFVDDGSTDDSVNKIMTQSSCLNVLVLQLTRNFGKEAALLAGLEYATGDAVVPFDIDMQDPIGVIEELVRAWLDGAPRVVAVRRDRSAESWFKHKTSNFYYKLLKFISDSPIEPEVGDFQLLDRAVLDKFLQLREKVRYTKGLFSWMGYHPVKVEYDRLNRRRGRSKFGIIKLLALGLNGVFSLSVKPIKLIALIGIVIAILSFILAIYFLSLRLLIGAEVPGYASLAVMISFFSGVQIIFLGIIGMYVGTVLKESKDRPIYMVEKVRKNTSSREHF